MASKPSAEINLKLGWPNPGLLPVTQLRVASQVAFSDPEAFTRNSLLEYGPDDGYLILREKIAKWLTMFYVPNNSIGLERICITGGASQNLACVLQTYTDPSSTQYIWMTAPTYFCACRVFDDAGFAGRLRAVPENDEGIDVEFLAKQLQLGELQSVRPAQQPLKTARPWSKAYRHIIYAVPTFSNPSGRVMSRLGREALVRLARKHDALIIADDVYDMLQWRSDPSDQSSGHPTACEPRIVDVDAYLDGGPTDRFGNSISNGSFSKIIGPGLRTGWSEGTAQFTFGLSQTGSTRSGGCASHFGAVILAQILDTSLPGYIETMLLPTYARRYHKVMRAIKMHLQPLGVTTPPPDKSGFAGGYYVWLKLPTGLDAENVARSAMEEQNLLLHSGRTFLVEGDSLDLQQSFLNCIRVCFVWVDEGLLVEGIERVAAVLRASLAQI